MAGHHRIVLIFVLFLFAGISSSQTSWEITPNQFMMEPKQVRNIRVYFKPRKAELDKVRQVYTAQIGTLKIIHGDEPTRLRIRRLNQVTTI